MATLNPDHLFEQAEKLIEAPPAGPPRQVDVRRAISAAYYAVFHGIVTQMADEMVGVTKRATTDYHLAYRGVDHRWLRELCTELGKSQLSRKYRKFAPDGGFGPNILGVSLAVVELQEKRHTADYDPSVRVKTVDALLAIQTGRSALGRLARASSQRRKRFLTLLAFPPR